MIKLLLYFTGSEKLPPKVSGLLKLLGSWFCFVLFVCFWFAYGKIWLLKGLGPKVGFDSEVSNQTSERQWEVRTPS